MIEIRKTALFDKWLKGLKDQRAKARILVRITRLSLGNPGDVKPVGEGVSELRISEGQGYRVYYVSRGDVLIILLCGGDKSSQQADIKTAKAMAKELE
ncbi:MULTISPECIES: type II toxin-antitoxin system RelE/ParE family toxin [unclassified Ruegeria]|uniref:type II toxin-antitoxin system RelE/ParE family toxin n=1 Tax=unclassified Ruegeria TaxID=2625375 RepID=UPI0014909214|nr:MULTISPECIES: type II toxin-antitoxin system RelE/ParE family toxin [unclassified Ruegeria]NOD37127.1 type II toxin-antitoxin system RelE/ParE family toxin [Ruegeria sp. HKCCD7296]NOE44311.1 type II toxin-antitoxin system RelE/ParE family toxin [Ruegeria sp. HKCCD7319]